MRVVDKRCKVVSIQVTLNTTVVGNRLAVCPSSLTNVILFRFLQTRAALGHRGFMDFREASAVFESVEVMRLLILRIEAMQSSGKKMA